MKQFKRVMAMLLCLVMTLGLFAGLTLPASAATLDSSARWTEVTWSQIVDGDVIVIGNTNNKALPSTTASTNPAKTTITVSGSAGNLTITPGSGTINSLAWDVDVQSGAGTSSMIAKLYQHDSTTINLYLTGTSSNTALRVNNNTSNNQFTMGSGGKLLKVTTGSRYVGEYVSGSDWRTYNSETAGNYSSQSLKFYKLNTSAPAATLSSIALSGHYPTKFTTGDPFSHTYSDTGMVVTATYSDSSTADVTSSAIWSSPDMSTAGTKTVTVSYTEGSTTKTATYTIFVSDPDKTLSSIALSGHYPTKFTTGDPFSHTYSDTGMVVTATYSDSSTADVTSSAIWSSPDMSTAGTKTVTVSYTEGSTTKTATYTINVADPDPASITLSRNGTTETPSGTYYVGDSYTLPGAGSDVNGHKHVGWSSVTIPTPGSKPTTNYYELGATVSSLGASQTFYAVYAIQEGSGNTETRWKLAESIPTTSTTVILAGKDSSGNYYAMNSGSTSSVTYVTCAAITVADDMIDKNTTTTNYEFTFNPSDPSFTNAANGKLVLNASSLRINTGNANPPTSVTMDGNGYTQIYRSTNTKYVVFAGSSNGFGQSGTAASTDTTAVYMFTQQEVGGATYSGYTTAPQAQVNPTYTVSVASGITGGTVNASPATAEEGGTITVTATPNTGYELTALTYTPEGGSATNITGGSFNMPAANVTINATFSQITYTIEVDAPLNGTITATYGGNTYAEGEDFQAPEGATVTVNAVPDSGYLFGGWSADDAGTFTDASAASTTFTVGSTDDMIHASFTAAPTYSYTIYSNSVEIDSGTAASVTAPAAPASIQYTYDGDSTPTTFTFAGWAVQSSTITVPGAFSGTLYAAGATIPLSANGTVIRAIFVNGSGAGFNLSYTYQGTEYFAGAKGSGDYLSASTDATDAVGFGMEQYNNSEYYYLFYTVNGDKYYLTGTNSSTLTISSANTVPNSGYFLWKETESSGTYTFTSYNTSGTSARPLAFNNSTKDRFACYNSANTLTKTSGAEYLTEAGAPYYAVTYVENAGSDTVTNMPSNDSVREGNSYTIPDTTPVRAHYAFTGWNDGTAVRQPGHTFSNVTAAITLTAQWQQVSPTTVTFYSEDGNTVLKSATDYYPGETPTAPADPTKANSGLQYYEFAGWARMAGGAVESPITAIGSSESGTRSYYAVFTEHTATFTLSFTGRTKVATEGSFQSTVLTPVLTSSPSGFDATVTELTILNGSNDSIATVSTAGNVLTVTGVSAGSLTLTVSATVRGEGRINNLVANVTVQVIAGSGGAAGGYKLITKDNTGTDVSDYDWTGEYIFVAREYGTSEKINTWKVMSFNWTDATTATVGDGTGGDNITGFTLDPATADEFGVATATTGGVTISALHTGEADYTDNPTTTGQGLVFDRITGFSDGTNDITNQYVLVFERVDEVNNYYTIRIKGTNYYLTNSATSGSGDNHMGGTATPDSIGATLLWKLSWASSVKPITASATGDTTATPDVLLIESVQALNNSASRAIFYNQAGNGFRAYGSGAYGNLINNNSSSGYNVFLYGKNNPFVSEINYDGTPRNTTDAKIEVPWNYATQAGNSSLLLEGALVPETYPGWTILNSSIPTWNLVGAYNPNGTTFSSATSISAISGTQNANFNVANWTASDVGKYYVVRVNYQVQDPDGVIYDVPQQAMIVVTNSTNTYTTVLHEATSQNNTGSWTVPSRIGSTGVDLDAYVRDNYSTIYTDREEVNGLTASQPTTWTYTSQKGYTYTVSSAGVVTWDPATVTQDDVVEIKATAGLSGGGTTATVAEGSYVLYIKQLAYSGEVQATPDSSVTTIPYGDTAFAVTLDNFKNNSDQAPGTTTYSINAASEWTWTAATLNGTTVPVTKTANGATLDVTGLATGTQVIVRATNVIATSNVVANTHTVVTITGKIFTIGEDNSLAAVNDSFVLDFDRNAKLNVMANDRNADGATLTLGTAPAGVTLTKNADNTVSFTVPGGQLTETYTFTYTLSKSGETDSTATVTVKPATAIYYEDNNSLFTYNDGTQGKWSDEGTASDWTQDASAAEIGYDANVSGLTYSLGRVKKANVGKDTSYGTAGSTDKWPTMTFTFVGNAFEIDTFRDADAGMFRVTVDGTKYNVSTAYGATYDDTADEHAAGAGWTYDVAGNYYGMPVFVWGDPSSTATATSHTVTVQVLYTASFDYASPAAGNYDVLIDGVKIYNPNVGGTTYKYISFRDTVIAAGTLGVPTTEAHSYIATLTPTNLSVGVGYTGQLSVNLTDNGQTVSNNGYAVSYVSDDTSIATVDAASGLITGVAEGTATITATITPNGGAAITKTCVVNVTNTVYTVTYKLPNGDQTVTYTDSSISLGSGVTHLTAAELAEYNAHNYVFRGWASAAVADTTTQPATLRDDGASVTLTGDATYYAVYRYGTTDSDFKLKTDLTNPLVDGETIVIYETEGSPTNYLLSNADYNSTWNNFRLGVAAAPANGIVTTTNSSLYWEVVATNGGFLLMDEDGNYLTATDTDGQLVMTDTPDAKAIWNATTTGVTGANSVYIYNNETSPKYLQHYSGYPEFGAYTYDEAWANRNEMQIYVQQANASYYTTDLQSTTVRYTVNYYVNGTAIDSEQIAEGGNPSFPNVTGAYTEAAGYSHDYTFLGWIPEEYAEDTTTAPATVYTTANASSYTVNAGVSFHAVFTYTGAGSAAEGYTLSSSAPEAGDTVIIAIKSGSDYYALPHGATAASTWSGTAITLTNGAVADTTDLLWDVEATNNSSYPVKLTYGSSKYFKLNSSQLAYTGDGATGYMNFTASGDGFTMENSTPRYLAQSSAAFGVTSNSGDAATVYIFKYSSTGGSQSYYATTLGEATPITHSYAASITPTSLALHVGETGSVTATLTDNGTAVAGATPTYTTSLSSVATVAADGTVTAVANGNATITATYTVDGTNYTATCDVSVTTLATYNVTYMVNGSQYGETESVVQGNSPSFTAPSYDTTSYNAHNYEFLGWKEGSALSADTTETQTLYVAGNTHVISANTTYYAVYRYVEGGSVTTAVEDLSNGANADYVIAANVSGNYYAMSNSTFSGKLTGTQITTPGSSISASDATDYVVTIAKSADGYTISNGTNLLGWSSGTDFATSANTYWSITTGSHGSYRVTNVGSTSTSTTRGLTYRTGTVNKFAPYATSNINGTEYYDVEIIPVGGGSGTTYYATTLNVAAAHSYVASISPSSVTIEEGEDTYTIGTLTDNGITTTAYPAEYTSSNSSVVLVDENTGYVLAAGEGTATVTVSYDVDGDIYSAVCNVTVTAATVVNSYTVTYKVNGNLYDTESVAENGNPSFIAPSTDISAYDAHSYTFVGWAASTVSETTTAPTTYTASNASSYTVTGDVTFHAVYTWSEGGSGSGTKELTFGFASNPGSWPTTASATTTNYTYTLDETDYTFALKNIKQNSGYLMMNYVGALGLPAIQNYTLTNVVAHSSSSHSTSTKVGISSSDSSASYVTGGSAVTWSTTSTDYTYSLTGTSANTMYYLYVTNKNAQITSLTLTYTGSGSGSGATSYYTTTLAAGDGTTATLSVSPSSLSMTTGGYAEIEVTAANGGTGAYVSASSSNTGVANVYALNDGNNTYGVTAGSAGSATITVKYYDSGANELASQTVSVTVTAASSGGSVGTNADYGRVGSDGNAPTTSGSTNAGTRGVVATSISQKAADYYSAKNTTWADLTALSGVYTTSSVEAASNNALKNKLQTLMTLTNTVTYSSLTSYWTSTDKSNGSSQNLYIYSNVTSNSSISREHVWPKSRGQFYESGAGSDLQHLRPEDSTINSTRGNHTMGYVNGVISGASTKAYSGNTVLWYSGSYSSNDCNGLVEVIDAAKGDVARILLYVYTEYPENTNLFTKTSGGGSGNNASDGNKVIESLNTLLEWCALDPVDTWEMSRNDACQTIQGNRNVFIDYPELAWMIFNLTPPSTMQTPSGQASVGNVGTRNSASYRSIPKTSSYSAYETASAANDAAATRSIATRAVGESASDLPVTGAVMVDAKGEISNNADVVSYLANYGAKNCLIVPAGGAVVFYLNNGADGTEVSIGANAINGTGTTLKVYQINAVTESAATGTVLLEQAIASSTEMYYKINGITWTGDKTNVLMVRNEGSAPMIITNLRATGNPDAQISTRAIHQGIDVSKLEMVIDNETITAAVAAMNALNEGTFGDNDTPIIPITTPVAVLTNASLSLDGLIGVNFYVTVPSTLKNSGYYFTINGEKVALEKVTGASTAYRVTGRVAAKEMNDLLELKFFDKNGNEQTFGIGSKENKQNSFTYTVREYLEYVEENADSFDAKVLALCSAMSDYGSYAQTFFNYDKENAAAIQNADAIAAVTVGEEYGYTYDDDTAHITYYGPSVVTESETAIRIYFKLSGDIDDYSVTVNGEAGEFVAAKGMYYVEISNIAAKDLGKGNTVTVTYGDEKLTVSGFSVYTYVRNQLNNANATDALKNAVKALKFYGDAAANYFKEEN